MMQMVMEQPLSKSISLYKVSKNLGRQESIVLDFLGGEHEGRVRRRKEEK